MHILVALLHLCLKVTDTLIYPTQFVVCRRLPFSRVQLLELLDPNRWHVAREPFFLVALRNSLWR